MHRRPETLKRAPLVSTLVMILVACQGADDGIGQPAALAGDSAAGLLPPAASERPCGTDGKFSARLYGALEGTLEWRGNEMSCEGMPRPDGRGARVRFSGNAGDDNVAFVAIVAIPALERGDTATELPSNVTLIEEGSGRFFSTPDLDNCWTDVSRHEPVESNADVYRVDGAVYCIAPVGEVNGDSSITIERLEFVGRIDWSAS